MYATHISYVNSGGAPVAIDSIYMNGVPVSSYRPKPVLGGDFSFLPSLCESGVIKEGTITFLDSTVDPSGKRLSPGTTFTVSLHTTSGYDYFVSVTLP